VFRGAARLTRRSVKLNSDVETDDVAPSSEQERHRGAIPEGTAVMDWKLEVVVIPVTDIDRAKSFYVEKLGFRLDADTQPTPAMRVVHMTPPGSACSVVIGPVMVPAGTDLGAAASLQLVVDEIEVARSHLAKCGVEVSGVQTLDPRDGGKFVFFQDPDGNNWAVQEVRERVGAPLA
jgi:catechol 2,3-dioxygenase-like lactoylglutathione lyase family enzyme